MHNLWLMWSHRTHLVVHDDNPLTSIVDDRYSWSEGPLKELRGGSLLHAAFSLIPKSSMC